MSELEKIAKFNDKQFRDYMGYDRKLVFYSLHHLIVEEEFKFKSTTKGTYNIRLGFNGVYETEHNLKGDIKTVSAEIDLLIYDYMVLKKSRLNGLITSIKREYYIIKNKIKSILWR